jgi:hypothetical protein
MAEQTSTVKETPKNITPLTKTETKKAVNLKYQRDKDRQPVKGVFRFYEVPGGTLSFVFRAYKEDPVERFDMTDGQIYTIPLGVARHLNKNPKYPVHAFRQDEGGGSSVIIGKKVARCAFQSLEFIDIEDMTDLGDSTIIDPSTFVG